MTTQSRTLTVLFITLFGLGQSMAAAQSLGTTAPAGQQSAATRAASVLAEARKALGGADKLRAVTTLEAAGTVRRSMGEMQMDGELEILLATPDKLRRNEELTLPVGSMQRTETINGNDVWDDHAQRGNMGGHGALVIQMGPGGPGADPERVKELQRRTRRAELARSMIGWLLASDAPVVHAGIAEAPDGRADILEFAPAEGPATKLFVDQQTHLPLMLSWQGLAPRVVVRRSAGGDPEQLARDTAAEAQKPAPEATFELRLADYREVDGVLLPHEITRTVNGQPSEEWTIKRYKVNPSFKANTFTK